MKYSFFARSGSNQPSKPVTPPDSASLVQDDSGLLRLMLADAAEEQAQRQPAQPAPDYDPLLLGI